jgi:hypothetical protein
MSGVLPASHIGTDAAGVDDSTTVVEIQTLAYSLIA